MLRQKEITSDARQSSRHILDLASLASHALQLGPDWLLCRNEKTKHCSDVIKGAYIVMLLNRRTRNTVKYELQCLPFIGAVIIDVHLVAFNSVRRESN
jgi:hypothetical protein